MGAFRHKTAIQVRFKDVDSLGHVNHANHITYFEVARVDYFDKVMGDLEIDWKNEGLILAKIEMEYKQPILLNDRVAVYTSVSKMGIKSFEMTCEIVKEENGKEIELARGKAIIVCFNYVLNQTIQIPRAWREKVTGF